VKPQGKKKKEGVEAQNVTQDTKLEIKDDEKELVIAEANNPDQNDDTEIKESDVEKLEKISKTISEGANIFLFTEYFYLLIFISCFALLIFLVGEHKRWMAYTTIAFLIGSLTSILCGWIGMKIATESNYRTTYSA
jgi:inorganic pyrophosphatase